MADQKQETLSAEACYEYVYHKVFPLRPADYCTKYPKWPGLVGLEVEMLPLWTKTMDQKKPATVPLFDEGGLVPALEGLKAAVSLAIQLSARRSHASPNDQSRRLGHD